MRIDVRPLPEDDLDVADVVLREAFTAELGADLLGDTDVLRTRSRSRHVSVLGAYAHDELVGSVVATRWGAVGGLGPLSVAPRAWSAGVGTRLLGAAVDVLDGWGAGHQSLFTFPNSPRHVSLYQRFGFWPRHLTAIMSRPVASRPAPSPQWLRLSEIADLAGVLAGCAELTGAIMAGLDIGGEIVATLEQKLGDVVLLGDPAAPDAVAVCHVGPGTEAGSGIAYVKVAAVAPGPAAPAHLATLLDACAGFAAATGAERLVLGVSTARREAYRFLVAAGLRTDVLGVAMHRPDGPGYDRPDVFLLDDRR